MLVIHSAYTKECTPGKGNARRFCIPGSRRWKEFVLFRNGDGVASTVVDRRVTCRAVDDGVPLAAGHGRQCDIVIDKLTPLH